MRHVRTERVPKEVTFQTECDACGKLEGGHNPPHGWHHFSRSHGDWGNDSVESFDYFDVCSWDCYLTVVLREFNAYGDPAAIEERVRRQPRGRWPTLKIDDKDWGFLRDMLRAADQAGFFDPGEHSVKP